MEVPKKCIYSRLLEKISSTEKVLQEWNSLKGVKGADKLKRKILAELKFLKKLQSSTTTLKEDHLLSSNLSHLQAIVHVAQGGQPASAQNIVAILEPFAYRCSSPVDEFQDSRLVVDVVAHEGKVWMKVVARNPKALHFISTGQCQFGERTILDQAKDFTECSKQHTYHFVPPTVKFVFQAGVTYQLAARLESLGVEVVGDMVESDIEENAIKEERNEESSSESDEENDEECNYSTLDTRLLSSSSSGGHSNQLNLDITALIAYVSALTNGHCRLKFKEPILTQQALWETRNPVKPELDKLFEGRELICCHTAMDDFKSILKLLGGEGEKVRANEFFNKITVVPDQPSDRAMALRAKGRVKERSKVIFGTGDTLKVVTVTANSGFVRSAQSQGVSFAVLLHESRALTEGKQKDAIPLDEDEP